jgi:hypothetical protein
MPKAFGLFFFRFGTAAEFAAQIHDGGDARVF